MNERLDIFNECARDGSSIDIAPLDATFRDSSRAPLHSWFPYLEGYSPRFVQSVLREYLPTANRILEPFAGSGTTPIVLGQMGVECAFSEANPAMVFVIKTKLDVLRMDTGKRTILSDKLIALNRKLASCVGQAKADANLHNSYISTFDDSTYFEETAFENILKLRTIVDEALEEDLTLGNCLLLAIIASLIPSSRLKRSGDLRFKTPKELAVGTPCIIQTIKAHLLTQAKDIVAAIEIRAPTTFLSATAGGLHQAVDGLWDGVITSPPYLNGTNYIRNARLELWFLRKISSKADLRSLRDQVITSGINDVDAKTDWRPVTSGVERVVTELEEKAYDQRIAKMVGGYFRDMHVAMAGLTASLNEKGRLCIDIGDSIYANVHVPTDDLLVEVAHDLGLRTVERIHLRKRTSKSGQPVRQQLLVFEK